MKVQLKDSEGEDKSKTAKTGHQLVGDLFGYRNDNVHGARVFPAIIFTVPVERKAELNNVNKMRTVYTLCEAYGGRSID